MDISWAFNTPMKYKQLTGHDGFNQPTFGPEVELKGWFGFRQKLIRTANGEERASEAMIKAPLTITPRAGDIFTVQGEAYKVMNPGTPPTVYGETGHHSIYAERAVKS